MKKISILLALTALLLSACTTGVTGSGNLETRSYDDLGTFDAVSLSAFGTVYLSQGETTSIEVEADDNIFRYLEIEVHGNTLELGFDSGRMITDATIVYTITTPNLDSINVSGAGIIIVEDIMTDNEFRLNISGAGDVNIDDLIADTLRVNLSGAGDINIEGGRVESQRIEISGLGSYDAAGLQSDETDVAISGAGDAHVWADDTLDISISGAGSVRYTGDAKVNQSISGLGSVSEE